MFVSTHAGSTSLIHLEVDGSDYFTGVRVRPGLAMCKLMCTHEISYNSDPTTRVPTCRARQSLSSEIQFMKIRHCYEDV